MDYADKAIARSVAARRARTGRKFETVPRMQPAFADLDAAGGSVWPETWAEDANAETRRLFGVSVRPLDDMANSAKPDVANSDMANKPSYRYRKADARRAYMRDYMRKRLTARG